MTLFIGFTIVCFIGGLLLGRLSFTLRTRLLLGFCLFMAFAYYFLDQV